MALSNPPEVIPLHDVREHHYGFGCWCEPANTEGVIVHNSADGREEHELGKKLN